MVSLAAVLEGRQGRPHCRTAFTWRWAGV